MYFSLKRKAFLPALLVFSVLLTLVSAPPSAIAASTVVQDPVKGNWYEFVPGKVPHQQAYTEARAKSHLGVNGHLATITSASENSFVRSIAGTGVVWIGAHRIPPTGRNFSFQWMDGPETGLVFTSCVDFVASCVNVANQYTNWSQFTNTRQPDGNLWGVEEEAVAMDVDGTWGDCWGGSTDWDCNLTGYVVEYENPTPPNPPTNVLASNKTSNSVRLNWTAPADNGIPVTSYKVEYLPKQGSWTTFASVSSSTLSATVTGLQLNTPYKFRITSVSTGNPDSEPTLARYTQLYTASVTAQGGDSHTCSLATDGSVQCWGKNSTYYGSLGLLGDGTSVSSDEAVLAQMPESVTQLAVGPTSNCAIGYSKLVYCWGRVLGTFGGVGSDGTSFVPTVQSGLTGVVKVVQSNSAQYNDLSTACAITDKYQAYCWGHGYQGQFGDGTNSPYRRLAGNLGRNTPVAAIAPAGVGYVDASTSGLHTCLIGTDSKLYCTGDNTYGQLAISLETSQVVVPTLVMKSDGSPLSSVTSVSASAKSTCAVASGDVYCWGSNSTGQLGTGNRNDYFEPQKVNLGWMATEVSVAGEFTCALTQAGEIYCWGSSGSDAPLRVSPQAATFTDVTAVESNVCVTSVAGDSYCGRGKPQFSTPIDPWIDTLAIPQPANVSLTPTSGSVGTFVTIAGDQLQPVTRVQLEGTDVTFAHTGAGLSFYVPSWAQGGASYSVKVISAGGSALSVNNFQVTSSPIVTVNLTVLSSDAPVKGGSYSWLSQGKFSPPVPISGNSTGSVMLTNVVSGPGTISISGGVLPDGRTVSGFWNVTLQEGNLTLSANPPAEPALITASSFTLFPDGAPVPGARVSAVGISDSYSDVNDSFSLSYFLPSAVLTAVTDVDGLAVLHGYKTSNNLLATAIYDDGVIRRSSEPVVMNEDSSPVEIPLGFMPFAQTSSPNLSAYAGDIANVVFEVSNNGTPVANQAVTLTELSVEQPPTLAGTFSSFVLAECPTLFSGTTDSDGRVTISLCTAVSGLHTYSVSSPGAVKQFPQITLNVSTEVSATSLSLSGPGAGLSNQVSADFTVAPDGVYTGTVTVNISGAGLNYSTTLEFQNSAVPQTFRITPSTSGTVILTIGSVSPSLILPSAISYLSYPPPATSFAFTGPNPSSGAPNVASKNFTITPNGVYTGTVSIQVKGAGLNMTVTKVFNGSSTPQSFSITPTTTGTVVLTPSSSPLISNPQALTYSVLTANPVPTFSTVVSTANGFSVNVKNYSSVYAYTISVSAGTVSRGTASGSTLPLTVSGLAAGASATVTVTASRTGYSQSTGSVTGSSTPLFPALTPTFSVPVSTSTGFTVNVTNYSALYSFAVSSSAGTVVKGTASGSTLPLTVSGLAAGESATVTVTVTRTGYANGSGSVSGAALPGDPFTPTFSVPVSTSNGFTVNVTNYSALYSFAVSSSAGTVVKGTASGSTLPLTVSGLAAGESATVTVTVTRTGYATGSSNVMGTSTPLLTGLTPTFSVPVSTSTGFTVNVTNYSALYSFAVSSSAGTVLKGTASGSTLPLTVSGLAAGVSATVTVTVTRTGYATGSSNVMGTSTPLLTGLTPTFSVPVSTSTGFTVNVTNYSALYSFAVSSSAGTVLKGTASGSTLPLTVSGLAAGVSATVTVTVTRTGYATGSASVSGSALLGAALRPTFSVPVATSTGFTVNITNYNSLYTYALSGAGNGVTVVAGSASASILPLTVTGVTTGAALVQVTVSRAGYNSGVGTVSGNALPVITGLSTTSVGRGASVVVTGTNLWGATSLRVGSSSTYSTKFTIVSATKIIFNTAATSTVSGSVVVVTPGGTANGPTLTINGATSLAPTVISMSRTTGGTGTAVLVSGNNLGAATSVTRGSTIVPFRIIDIDQIVLAIPSGLVTGSFTITTPGGTTTTATYTASSSSNLPSITSLSMTVSRGDIAILTGLNIGAVRGLTLNGTALSDYVVIAVDSIAIRVPTSSATGVATIVVTTAGGSVTTATVTIG